MTDHPGDLDDTVLRARATAARRTGSVVRERRDGLDDTVLTGRPSPGRAGEADDGDAETVLTARSARDRTVPSGRPVPPAPVAPVVASPPARLHSLRVAGEVLPLDVPVVVGRRPSAPRVQRGAPPRLRAAGAPGGSVSASHVDVRQEGEVVVVTDLRSTNGTRVQQPGRPAVQLRQGESVVVLAGTVVDLGDGVVLEILPPQRLTLKDGPQP